MPLPQETTYTSEDYWNLPSGERAELINGRFYAMAPPNRIHQKLVSELTIAIGQYIKTTGGDCEIYPAPFAVNLDKNDKNWVEPDISVICDKNKLTKKGCSGAPDFIIEIVSPTSRKTDYTQKNALYSETGVREYWIIDPAKERTTVYHYEEDAAPTIYPFTQELTAAIYKSATTPLTITIANLLK